MPEWIQHVEVDDALGVEAMRGRRAGQTEGDWLARPKVKTEQSDVRIGFHTAVDPRPHLDQVAPLDAGVELAAAQHRQQLTGRRNAGLPVEELVEIVWH